MAGRQAADAGALPGHPRPPPAQAAGRVRAGPAGLGLCRQAIPRSTRSRSTSTGVAGTILAPRRGFGLEAGSKPELMAVLALSRPGGLIVCNGYKGPRKYIRLALIGRKLGLQTFIVIESPRAEAGAGGGQGAGRAAGPRRAHAAGVAGRRQVAEQRRRQGQVRARPAPAAGPVEAPARRRHGRLPAAAALPHGQPDQQRARHRQRHARGDPLLRRAVAAGAPVAPVDVGGGLGIDYRKAPFAFVQLGQLRHGRPPYASSIVQPWPRPAARRAGRRRASSPNAAAR